MKKINYIVWLLFVVPLLTACEKIEPDLFDSSANGAYFDYEYAADFDKTLNFSDHIVGNPDTVSVTLKVKLLGYLMEDARSLSVKTKEIEGYAPADVIIGDVTFVNKEYEKDIEVRVKRPEFEDSVYAICIYLDGSGDIGTGINGKTEIKLYVTESYEKPAVWYSHVETYLGEWTKEKHKFLAQHTGNNHFYSELYDENTGLHLFDSIMALNVSAVNALLSNESQNWENVDIPILKESDYPDYVIPYFWQDYEEFIGLFKANKFCRLVSMLGGYGTKGLATLFASEESLQIMKSVTSDFHKADVYEMLNLYYGYALQGYPIAEYRNLYWVEMKNNVNYNVRIPFWWEDPNNFGTADIVKRYFGEYDADKYQFMLKTMLKEDGSANFITESILPFVYDIENNTYAWDNSPFGEKQLSGEERLKECYRLIKAANDKRPESRRFDIPDVVLE